MTHPERASLDQTPADPDELPPPLLTDHYFATLTDLVAGLIELHTNPPPGRRSFRPGDFTIHDEASGTTRDVYAFLLDHAPDALLPADFDSIEDVFEYGYCNALALALNETTGWTIVGLRAPDGYLNHYLAQTPDGRLVDVRGTRTATEVLQAWGDHHTVRGDLTPAYLWQEVRNGDMEDPADVWPLAQAIAARLVADHHARTDHHAA